MNMSEVKSLEHSTLKVPYEILNKKFRIAQKNLDREVNQVQFVTKEMEKCLQNKPTVSDIQYLLEGVVEKLQVMKRKSNDCITDELNATFICKRKLHHLQELSHDHSEANIDQWKRIRTDRMVIEHFLRLGYYETADKLAKQSEIKHLTNLDIFQTSRDVEEDLKNHRTSKCIYWCIDNKSKLRKINSTIEFQLRVQDFIELIRDNQRSEAVKYSRKYLTTFKEQISDITMYMALLAYPVNTTIEKYKSLFNENRWKELILSFRNENYRLFQLSNQSVLTVAIQAGLSALKTPQCYSTNSKNVNCPVCQQNFNDMASNLPFSHCAQSRLICRITGLPLNEHNLPMMLPNGQIFGQLAIPQITKENGIVVCPITNTKFTNPKIEKVFVM